MSDKVAKVVASLDELIILSQLNNLNITKQRGTADQTFVMQFTTTDNGKQKTIDLKYGKNDLGCALLVEKTVSVGKDGVFNMLGLSKAEVIELMLTNTGKTFLAKLTVANQRKLTAFLLNVRSNVFTKTEAELLREQGLL